MHFKIEALFTYVLDVVVAMCVLLDCVVCVCVHVCFCQLCSVCCVLVFVFVSFLASVLCQLN